MKKSLIALAVLAASGAAMAQSSVTLYGIADVYYGNVQNTNVATQNVIASGGVNTSRWGLKGSEDLGGGLKANFNLEQGFRMDSGEAANSALAFARQSWVGLSGDFGAVRVGRTTTPFEDISGTTDGVFDSLALAPMYSVFQSSSVPGPGRTAYNTRPNNTIYYASPTMSGFNGALSYSLGENKTATVDAGATTSLYGAYAGGPVYAALGYQTEKATGNTVARNFTRVNASYDLGVAKLLASLGRAQNMGAVSGADANEWQLGANYSVSSALTLSGSIAASKDNATAGDAKRQGYGLGAKYDLSKRTFVYGGYESDKTTKPLIADTKHSVFAVGMQHRF